MNISLKQRAENIIRLKKQLSFDFSDTVTILIIGSGLTLEELSENSRLSVKTLSRWKNNWRNDTKIKYPSLVQFCVGLNLPPEISELLFKIAGLEYSNTVSDLIYRRIRDKYYHSDIETINQILESEHLPLWEEKSA